MDKSLTTKLFEKVITIGEDVSGIKTTMIEHDKIFTEIKDTLIKIDSKHNSDYLQYIESKEKLETRIKPLEDDYIERCKFKEENRVATKRLFFSGVEKVAIWVGGILIGVILLGHTILDAFTEYFKR
jgi:hypothetical protein